MGVTSLLFLGLFYTIQMQIYVLFCTRLYVAAYYRPTMADDRDRATSLDLNRWEEPRGAYSEQSTRSEKKPEQVYWTNRRDGNQDDDNYVVAGSKRLHTSYKMKSRPKISMFLNERICKQHSMETKVISITFLYNTLGFFLYKRWDR